MKTAIQEHIENASALLSMENDVDRIITAIKTSIMYGGKILICGNGGSAADAQHFAAELVGRFKKDRRAIPAIALTTDSSVITAIANDYSYNTVFARQIDALANWRDCVIGISTSGNSQNVYNALSRANEKGCCSTVALLGGSGGKIRAIANHAVVVPSTNTARVQECHILLIHYICEKIEEASCSTLIM